MTPATLRELAGEPPVLCMDCEKARPAKGYDLCCECQAAFLRANPAELAEFLTYEPVDAWDLEIRAMVTDDEQRKRA